MTETTPLTQVDHTAAAAAEDSEALRQLKDKWLSSLNYEIRTPLAGLVGMVDLLLETRLDTEQREYAKAARECAASLLSSFSAMVEYSALSAGTVRVEELEFHLGAMLNCVITEYKVAAEAKGLRFRFLDDRGLNRFVLGDQERIRQILRQLLSNAVKFTHEGEIQVLASYPAEDDSRLRVSVLDTGIGITPREMPHIFDSFYHCGSGLARLYAGIGMGLSLARKLAQLLGGDVDVASEPGRGSVFSFHVRLRDAAPQTVAPEDVRERARPRRILLVDDNRISQRIITHFLRRRQYEVDCVDNGLAALEAFAETDYGLVLMDLQMPGMDGLEATRKIRQAPGGAQVPIIAVTANTSDQYRQQCLAAGMHDFVAKPLEPPELLDAVARHLPLEVPAPGEAR